MSRTDLLGLLLVVGGPVLIVALLVPATRAAIARRIGGHAEDDEARLVALQFQVAALERQVEVLTQALQRFGAPASSPPQLPPPADRSLMR